MIKTSNFYNSIWTTPIIKAIPEKVNNILNNKVLLTNQIENEWKFLFEEIEDIPSPFSKNQDYDFSKLDNKEWNNVIVPSSLLMQGFNIKNNIEYYYKRVIEIPEDFKENRIILYFEGVYSHCRVWIDNKYITTHIGGFIPWNCDITDFVKNNKVTLIVGVADIEGSEIGTWNKYGEKLSDSAWASYYAHHNIGGILRNITLFTLPKNHLSRVHLDTILDEDYKNATLSTKVQINSFTDNLKLKIELFNNLNELVKKEEYEINNDYIVDDTNYNFEIKYCENWIKEYPEAYENDKKYEKRFINNIQQQYGKSYVAEILTNVETPKLWDAEHPNLYALKVSLFADGEFMQTNSYKLGFRHICYGGMRNTDKNKVYINGKEIKLRGVCRHDVSYKYGRCMNNEEIKNEILSYKKNNINHIRTSHYPASDYLLQLCDEYGIYVEQENSACFKGDNGFDIYNEPQEFISTFSEMIESSRNHCSIIIWSLANESGFEKTYAFRTEYLYVKEVDKTRPVIFSYPYTVKTTPLPYDIYSRHYANIDTEEFGSNEIPHLHDEFAHIACYNLDTLKKENGSRNAWGKSIKKGWEKIFNTDGALGCALWGAIDEIFYIPNNTEEKHQNHSKGQCAGYGEWGAVLDVYGREKPEAYLTKKAFSPIRLDEEKSTISDKVNLYLENWFDHTNLNEIKIKCLDENNNILYDDIIKENIIPHSNGNIILNIDTKNIKTLNISFYQNDYIIDNYLLYKEKNENKVEFNNNKNLVQLVENDFIMFNSDKNSLKLNLNNGLIEIINNKGLKVFSGISLFSDKDINIIKNSIIDYKLDKGFVIFTLEQEYSNNLNCIIKGKFNGEKLKLTINTLNNDELLDEFIDFGVKIDLENDITKIEWERNGLYSTYPDNHIGRNKGTAFAKRENSNIYSDEYGIKPKWNWEQDMTNYFLFEKDNEIQNLVTNDFKVKRTNIIKYTLEDSLFNMITVNSLSDNLSAFVNKSKSNKDILEISLGEYYKSLEWGNYCGEKVSIDQKKQFEFIISVE